MSSEFISQLLAGLKTPFYRANLYPISGDVLKLPLLNCDKIFSCLANSRLYRNFLPQQRTGGCRIFAVDVFNSFSG